MKSYCLFQKVLFIYFTVIIFATVWASASPSEVDPALKAYGKVGGISGSLSSVGSDTLNNLMTLWAEKSQWMLKASLDAFVDLDLGLARKVCFTDDEVDIALKEMYRLFKNEVIHDPERIERLTQLLSVSRYLERIADLATNIAEDVVYLSEGQIVRHRSEVFFNA